MQKRPEEQTDDELIGHLREDLRKVRGGSPLEDQAGIELDPVADEDFNPGIGMGD
jgi:hypothetical protein